MKTPQIPVGAATHYYLSEIGQAACGFMVHPKGRSGFVMRSSKNAGKFAACSPNQPTTWHQLAGDAIAALPLLPTVDGQSPALSVNHLPTTLERAIA